MRVFLPVNAGATWNDLCFAISPSTTTGLNENAMNTNSFIYPNPSTDRINLNTAEVLDIRIYNYTGQIVKAIPNNSGQIDVSDLNNGIYFLQVSTKVHLLHQSINL
ncbi:MAG: T9SS type A sorting domain-containing protein [Bacteroidetes bacterium]|nr:T9SS type A sorting domain-containing protein [Bacteroidota bacterium]